MTGCPFPEFQAGTSLTLEMPGIKWVVKQNNWAASHPYLLAGEAHVGEGMPYGTPSAEDEGL